jgi:hypothetical protein
MTLADTSSETFDRPWLASAPERTFSLATRPDRDMTPFDRTRAGTGSARRADLRAGRPGPTRDEPLVQMQPVEAHRRRERDPFRSQSAMRP